MDIDFNTLVPEFCVRDISKSLAFYELLGFKVLYQRESEKFAYVEFEGSQLMLEELSEGSWMTGAMEPPFGRGINFQIEARDVDHLYDISVRHGFQTYKSVYEKWYRVDDQLHGQRQFLVQDPDGYLLRFCMNVGRKPA